MIVRGYNFFFLRWYISHSFAALIHERYYSSLQDNVCIAGGHMWNQPLVVNASKVFYGAKKNNNHFLKSFFVTCGIMKVKESGFHFKPLFLHAHHKNPVQ